MQLARFIEFEQAFDEPKSHWQSYLSGIDNDTLLLAATHFLGRHELASNDYYSDMEQIFGPHNANASEKIFRRLAQLERQLNSKLKLVHPKSALRLFEYGFQRTDEPRTQSEPEVELSFFKAFAAQNDEYGAEQNTSVDEAIEQGVSKIAMLSLAGAHSDFDLVNVNTPRVLLMQLLKSVRLFQFLESDATYYPLLTAFLQQYQCPVWQDYMRRLAGLVKAIVYAEKPGRTEIHVPHDEEFEETCAFLDNFSVQAGEPLDKHDFLSLRSRPIYKQSEGIYGIIFPVFVAEILHKALFFQFNELVRHTKPKLLKGVDWRGAYCQTFSEDYLLGKLLDAIFEKRGLAWSGQRIKAGGWLAGRGDAEPDYYFRSGKRVLLFESKDVNIKKEAKAGQDFAGFLRELRKKFYHGVDEDGSYKEGHDVGVLQLIHNIKRLLSPAKELRFDQAYKVESLIIYPVLVVHDRLYNMPGLNELVNSWFQQELAKLGPQAVQQVRPLVVIDIDTLLAYQDHFASKKLVLWDVMEAYYRSIKPAKRTVRSQQEASRLLLRTVDPFVSFLDDFAARQGQSPIPAKQFAGLLAAMGAITEPTSSEPLPGDDA